VKEAAAALGQPPSEYFRSNCYLGGPLDALQAVRAGMPNVMFGADVPHSEGTGPYTKEAIRVTCDRLSSDQVDDYLYRKAVEVYGFDVELLQGVADSVAPTRKEVRTPLRPEEVPSYPDQSRWYGFAKAGSFRD
jgi:hypothetical protein